MKFESRQFAAAALLFCPLLLIAQQAQLPSAPSAVIAERGFQRARDITFSSAPAQVTIARPASRLNLNTDQKFSAFVEQSMSPYSTLSSAVVAGFRPIGGSPQLSEPYAARLGQTISNQTKEQFFTKFLLPSMLHQDPRYHSSTQTGNVNRAMYAISRVFVARDDNSKSTFNTSELVGAVLAASISSAYHPYRRTTPGEAAGNAAATIGSDAGINMLREFWPDIRTHLMDHGPRLMQTLVTQLTPKFQSGTVPAAR
jgi:hypothetical protein